MHYHIHKMINHSHFPLILVSRPGDRDAQGGQGSKGKSKMEQLMEREQADKAAKMARATQNAAATASGKGTTAGSEGSVPFPHSNSHSAFCSPSPPSTSSIIWLVQLLDSAMCTCQELRHTPVGSTRGIQAHPPRLQPEGH